MNKKLIPKNQFFVKETKNERIKINARKNYYKTLMKLRDRRKEMNLTQEELAELSGVSRDTIARIETGDRNPTMETLFFLGEILNLEIITISK